MFAFLMVLGIVVDDAIIVGESIYSQQKKGLQGHKSAIIGTKTVLMPVMLAVVSTIIFFMPMVDVPKDVEPFTTSIFFVVCFCLIFSLVESLLILPTHLAHMKPEKPSSNKLLRSVERIRYSCSVSLERFTAGTYRSLLNKFLQRKVSTILAFIMVFAISLAMLFSGWVKSSFFPQVPQPFLSLDASFPEGSPYRYTTDLADYMKKQANSLNKNPTLLAKNSGLPFIVEVNTNSNGNQLNVFVGLTPAEERNVSIEAVKIKLQELIGPLPEVQNYSLASSIGDNNPDIELNLRLFSNSVNTQEQATNDITKILATYDGINNVRSNLDTGRLEAELELKDYAQTLGISTSDIATQVRQAFHGEELQRIPRSKEDVRVVLRFTESERRSLDTLDDMQIRTDKGHEIPLSSVADVSLVPSSSIIRRTDRIRNITITADITEGVNANQIITEMLASYGQEWKNKYTGFELSTDGNLRTQSEFGDNFLENFLLAFIIAFSLFAIAFKSIFAPLLILTAVPFGFMGAIFGHIIWSGVTGTDYNISMMSFFGFLACAGVVVNDNLVLLARIKHLRTKGYSAFEAVLNAGTDRFRAIILTSLTTFIGLLPILFERSTQSQFLIPMVISLAFGVLFASVVTLFMVPCVYLSGYSIGQRIQRLNKGIVTKLGGSTVAS
jgi:multidrug efflux pump subunit AcrB